MPYITILLQARISLLTSIYHLASLKISISSFTFIFTVSKMIVVSLDESNLKPVIVFYTRFCNVWFKEYLLSTRGDACKSEKSLTCLCYILSFYYNVLLLEDMLIFTERSLTEKLWIRGNKNCVFFIFFLYFSFHCFYKSLQWKYINRTWTK